MCCWLRGPQRFPIIVIIIIIIKDCSEDQLQVCILIPAKKIAKTHNPVYISSAKVKHAVELNLHP